MRHNCGEHSQLCKNSPSPLLSLMVVFLHLSASLHRLASLLVFCLHVQDDKKYNIIFEDPAFPQIGKNGKPDGLGDTWIVFYTLYEYESNGEKKIGKSPFFDANPKEYTYTGTHKAYEG